MKLLLIPTLLLTAFVAAPAAQASGPYSYYDSTTSDYYGIHPWELRERRYRDHDEYNSPYLKEYYLLHPDYSQTHALHPVFRERYYDPPYTRFEERALIFSNEQKFAPWNAYQPRRSTLADCGNYSFARPNYRVPPYEFNCTN